MGKIQLSLSFLTYHKKRGSEPSSPSEPTDLILHVEKNKQINEIIDQIDIVKDVLLSRAIYQLSETLSNHVLSLNMSNEEQINYLG